MFRILAPGYQFGVGRNSLAVAGGDFQKLLQIGERDPQQMPGFMHLNGVGGQLMSNAIGSPGPFYLFNGSH